MLRQRYRDSRAETDKARREMIDGMRRDAKPPVGAYPYSAAAEGGECTVNGESGTLQRRGDALVCVPRRQSAPHTDALPRTMSRQRRAEDQGRGLSGDVCRADKGPQQWLM